VSSYIQDILRCRDVVTTGQTFTYVILVIRDHIIKRCDKMIDKMNDIMIIIND